MSVKPSQVTSQSKSQTKPSHLTSQVLVCVCTCRATSTHRTGDACSKERKQESSRPGLHLLSLFPSKLKLTMTMTCDDRQGRAAAEIKCMCKIEFAKIVVFDAYFIYLFVSSLVRCSLFGRRSVCGERVRALRQHGHN
jgi:hypothetical protein